MPDVVLRLGTRGSPLALAQARETAHRLCAAHGWAADAVVIVPIRTTGDAIQDRALSEAGGKGLFTKELDVALADGAIDLAVHSAKDLPTVMPDGISIVGFLPREDVRDALIARGASSLAALPAGAHVGSASLRRQAQLRRLRPDLRVSLLRGNVQTRLAKVEAGLFDATLLALAGLNRLGLAHVATAILSTDDFLPAVGQGAIALAMRSGDTLLNTVAAVLDPDTGTALRCERAFLRLLDGSCRTPIAGHAQLQDGRLEFRGLVLSEDGAQAIETWASGSASDAERLGQEAARDLLGRAPADILAPFRTI
ncbi:hydroxymethylbilane synthase [Lichenihabitans sp. Uapishka_5]|uniref:hydroxymethylbilane synthase n=1 Tax=Lichenihabitans sp. Uapishka_5 TaxID=3037302 RepID=UPI0029E7CCE3|nr:hydroxymethylbilane synthase [Lichenihabitans sp. Uapishka_5]MDX7953158.1 hydroxymethylbilane synthase [Lichenihabitans sp. Uapishka_5]